jgi:MFS family permease
VVVGIQIPITVIVAIVSSRLLHSGVTSRISRGIVASTGAVLGGAVLMLLITDVPPEMKVACLAIGGVLSQLIFSFGPLMVGEICPETRRGGLLGIMSSVGTVGGVIAPMVMGVFIQQNLSAAAIGYEHGFFLLGLLLILSGLFGMAFLNPEKSCLRLKIFADINT